MRLYSYIFRCFLCAFLYHTVHFPYWQIKILSIFYILVYYGLSRIYLLGERKGDIMVRLLAVLVVFIPGIIAAIGIKLMRDTLFDDFHHIFFHAWIQFGIGLFLFLAGLAFLGGFIIYRDRKKQAEKKAKGV